MSEPLAPAPTGRQVPFNSPIEKSSTPANQFAPTGANVTIVGCGGAGINIARHFAHSKQVLNIIHVDTSGANHRDGEKLIVLGGGAGSGGLRSENGKDIERQLPQFSNEDLGVADVVIVIFSAGGGSGSTSGPFLMRDYAARGAHVIGVVITDETSTGAAKNTFGTLKMLTRISEEPGVPPLPLIVGSNSDDYRRSEVDAHVITNIGIAVDLFTLQVQEIDLKDRLRFLDPTKLGNSGRGLKLMYLQAEGYTSNSNILRGTESTEMVDSMLIFKKNPDEALRIPGQLLPRRIKKEGYYGEDGGRQIIATTSSDISSINEIIDRHDRAVHADKAQKHSKIDRLSSSEDDSYY